jgi:hypothetical protein
VSVAVTIAVSLSSAGVGVGGGLFLERLRQRHADQTRWHDERRRLYTAFLEACEGWQLACMDSSFNQIGMIREGEPSAAEIDGHARRKELDRIAEEIEIVGTPRIRAAIQSTFAKLEDFAVATVKVPWAVAEGPEQGAPALAAMSNALQAYWQARNELKQEIRRDFGLGAD